MSAFLQRRSARVPKPVERYGFTKTFEPLTEFHLFPKFPIELQLKIFKHALPARPKDREGVITVAAAKIAVADPNFGLYIQFVPVRLGNKQFATKYQSVIHSRADMALLETCKNSRKAFIEVFHNTLPTETLNGRIRFEDATMIIIGPDMEQPFSKSIFRAPEFGLALDSGYPLAKYFHDIKRLAIDDSVITKGRSRLPRIAERLSLAFGSLKFFGLLTLCDETRHPGLLDAIKNAMANRAQTLGLKSESVPECEVIKLHWQYGHCCALGGGV